MKKNFLTLIVMLCGLVSMANAQSLKSVLKDNALTVTKVSVPIVLASLPPAPLAIKDFAKPTIADNAVVATPPPPVCYNYFVSAAFTGGSFYYTTCGGIATSQYLDKGASTTICAREGTVTGPGPITKGSICN
ncbi:hypothetical protein IDJ75_21040 [Mucilaginibacter rigui]|uniref:Uncharacterized protein n=1 Tax=Mucilaginibacter rigui TaxID=534635 RepID=A0ABR7XD39_9SPHI|nr:hypothetical protein [Mucilaginibacter rigui]MBD1387782.1 hypothetical protein [Mucilaginibacter rigui]